MASFNFYLNFPGNTEEAFNFYKSVFGGEFMMIMRMKDTPEGEKLSPKSQNMIMHIAMPLGNNVLMGTDAIEEMGHKLNQGNNFHISVSPDSEAEARRIFDALSAGGSVMQPLAPQFWGALFGMFTDKFGIQWMVNYDEKRPG